MGNEDEMEQQVDLTKAEKLSEYKQLRSSTKGNITRIKTAVSKKNVPIEELGCRLDILEAYFKQALSISTSILRLCTPSECESDEKAMADIEDIYVAAKAKIKEKLAASRVDAEASALNVTTAAIPQSSMRRHIKLPTFDGKYSEFPKFMAIFHKMVNQDETLDDCERFLILKDNLSARALHAIDEFEITSLNYKKALDRLRSNFDKKNLMFEEHITALFSEKKVSSSGDLRELIDSVNTHLNAMLSFGNYKDITNAMIIYLVATKLDEESLAKWEESIDYTRLSTWDECSAVLTKRCENMEARETRTARCGENEDDGSKASRKDNRKAVGCKKNVLAIEKGGCEVCRKDGHNVESCRKFEAQKVPQRRKTARHLRLCFVCLQSGHKASSCQAKRCIECGGDHHKMLHKNNVEVKTIDAPGTTQAATVGQVAVHATMQNEGADVILATAVIGIKGRNGPEIQARALLDSASQLNLMCEPLMQRLKLKWTSCIMTAHSIADSGTNITRKVQASVKSRIGGYETSLEFYVLPKITSFKPDQFMNADDWGIPSNISLADPNFNKPGRIDVLLGAEIFWDLLSVGRITLKANLPRLQKTVLGWVVSGVTNRADSNERLRSSLMMTSSKQPGVEEELTALVEKFWLMEQVDAKTLFPTADEALCEEIFIKESRRDDTGRFVVRIPFKENVAELGDSNQAALRRFLLLEKRLRNNPVSRDSREKVKYLAPHTFVLRPESTSTKLRVVFDCSCKTSSGLSLNDVMCKGPIVQDDLLAIVLRFRCYKYAITADVTKMYRQAWVSEEDSFYQCILWRPTPNEDIEVYRLLTITYGTASAPYLATRCVKALGEQCAEKFPYGANKVLSDFYMDDLISGADSDEQLQQIYSEVSEILSSAGFELRKWYSNNSEFLKKVPSDDQEKPLRMNDAEIIKTLGIIWEPTSDVFRYDWPELKMDKPVTKRIVLAEIASLFDPLGLINPIIVKAKIFLQNLWIIKVHWDESLPLEDNAQWIRFREKLPLVKDIRVPRYILAKNGPARVELHGFCDASLRAYGACVYIRTVNELDEVTVALWSAKSRVAPLRTKSLPRLELLGAELLAKLLTKTQENLVVSLNAIYLWTDSEIVLNWL
ncbi:uncharacterized protein LOC118756930, partial [Rhagoletis pomonella]|uniref:uncharacterized protein LOC118756930 n=1 Tax=Rhagoletis pomonella TaxID=28610 RepID=UPI00177D6BBF